MKKVVLECNRNNNLEFLTYRMIRLYNISDSEVLQCEMAYVGYMEVCLIIKDPIGKLKDT